MTRNYKVDHDLSGGDFFEVYNYRWTNTVHIVNWFFAKNFRQNSNSIGVWRPKKMKDKTTFITNPTLMGKNAGLKL